MKDEMPNNEVQQDANEALALLLALGGRRHLTFIKQKNLMGFWADPDDPDNWAQVWGKVADLNLDGWNAYYSPNPVRPDFEGTKAAKRDILNVTTLYADFDPDPRVIKAQGYDLAKMKLMAAAKVFARIFPPNAAIASGNGLQMLWFLPEAVSIEEGERLMRKLNGAAETIDGLTADAIWNADRILRLPGTLNWPSSKKVEKGYSADPVQASTLALELQRRPDVEVIGELPEPTRAVKPRSGKLNARAGVAGPQPDWPPASPSEHLVALHEGWLTDAHYQGLIVGEAYPDDRSRCLMGVCAWYRKHGLTVDECASLIAYAGGAPFEHVEKSDPARAVQRAYYNSDAIDVFANLIPDNDAVIDDGDRNIKPFTDNGFDGRRSQPAMTDDAFEKLALGVSGLVGDLTDWGEANSGRHTRIPALVGALAGVSALSQGRWVMQTPGFETPLALQMLIVGETGTGKETTGKVAKTIAGLSMGVGAGAEYASAPALHNALLGRATQLWVNEEFGRFLRTHANDTQGHSHQVLSMAMRIHTSFFGYLPARCYAKSKDELAAVPNPMLVMAHQTAPAPLQQSLTHDSVEGGGLGRMLVVWPKRRPKQKTLEELGVRDADRAMSDRVRQAIDNIEAHAVRANLQQAQDEETEGNTYTDPNTGRVIWVIRVANEIKATLSHIRDDFEVQTATGGVRGALASRAYEQTLRVAGVVALGEAALNGTLTEVQCSEETLRWAADLVNASLDGVIPEAEEHAANTEAERLQRGIMRAVEGLPEEGGVWFKHSGLLQKVKGRGRSSRDVRDEIATLVDAGIFQLRFEKDPDGKRHPATPKQYRIKACDSE